METSGSASDSGTARRRRYARAAPPEGPLALTPTKVSLLRFLAEMRFLSLPQLARLCCPSERTDLSWKSARKHLRTLFDGGLVDVLPVSRLALAPPDAPNDATLLYGSAPNVYAPTAKGLQTLHRAGIIGSDWVKRTPASYGPKNSLFLAHDLEVRDVRVWLEECARNSQGEQKVLAWQDGPEAEIDLGQGCIPRWLRPDAWFVYQVKEDAEGKPTVLVGLVEVDRGTERGGARWQEKVKAYGALFASGRLQSVTGYRNARMFIICPDGRRVDSLVRFLEANAPPSMVQKLWLMERAGLSASVLTQCDWRRPGSGTQWPMISETP